MVVPRNKVYHVDQVWFLYQTMIMLSYSAWINRILQQVWKVWEIILTSGHVYVWELRIMWLLVQGKICFYLKREVTHLLI